MSSDNCSAGIGDAIDANIPDELFDSDEVFQEAVQGLGISPRNYRLMWTDENGGILANTHVYEQEEYLDA